MAKYILRPLCLLRGHEAHAEEPCSRCGRYMSYEDLAVRLLAEPLHRRRKIKAAYNAPTITISVEDCTNYPSCGCAPKSGCEIPF